MDLELWTLDFGLTMDFHGLLTNTVQSFKLMDLSVLTGQARSAYFIKCQVWIQENTIFKNLNFALP